LLTNNNLITRQNKTPKRLITQLTSFASDVVNCHEPSAGVVDNLEFKIKKKGSYNYEYKKGLQPQPHYA
jgi:hypothetical protein